MAEIGGVKKITSNEVEKWKKKMHVNYLLETI